MFKILEKLTAKNKKQDDIRMPSHLSAAEQKQVQTVIDRARGDSTVPHSAQDSMDDRGNDDPDREKTTEKPSVLAELRDRVGRIPPMTHRDDEEVTL
ncbi:hypothetical protein WF834_03605 [Faecalibacterium sp. HTF-128]|uniref:DUF4316 domain-containing protein n=1 Tax=Faecalibacterium wellingii TaxID=2929491 RepID=A0AB35Y9L8_9FIRM